MAVLFRANDLINVAIDDMIFSFSPLTMQQKQTLFEEAQNIKNNAIQALEFSKKLLKACLKKVEGIQLSDGSNYELEFDGGLIKDSCLDDLMNLETIDSVVTVAGSLLQRVPSSSIINPSTGLPIEGVILLKKT